MYFYHESIVLQDALVMHVHSSWKSWLTSAETWHGGNSPSSNSKGLLDLYMVKFASEFWHGLYNATHATTTIKKAEMRKQARNITGEVCVCVCFFRDGGMAGIGRTAVFGSPSPRVLVLIDASRKVCWYPRMWMNVVVFVWCLGFSCWEKSIQHQLYLDTYTGWCLEGSDLELGVSKVPPWLPPGFQAHLRHAPISLPKMLPKLRWTSCFWSL